MGPLDDPEAYLVTFERVAQAAPWPEEYWATLLAPYLWVRRHCPQTLSDAVTVMENYIAAEALGDRREAIQKSDGSDP